MNAKKNLLVTLANESYINQAKQLFSSVYWNAGWEGDYMLLAHEISEKKLKWFRDKWILIKKCKPIIKDIKSPESVKLSKFYMFKPEFKKWKNIVYLDADMIVKGSLDDLKRVRGFGAVLDHLVVNGLIDQFIIPSQMGKKTFNKLKKMYDIKTLTFKSGVMAFSSDVIKKDIFPKLIKLFKCYTKLTKSGNLDQPIFNLFFYKKWEELPILYNLDIKDFKFINYKKTKAIVIHFSESYKLGHHQNPIYEEWNSNLEKANKINLNKIPVPHKRFTQSEIKNYSHYLKIRSIFSFPNWIPFIDYQIGLIGIFLYDKFPKLYFILKKLKNKKFKN